MKEKKVFIYMENEDGTVTPYTREEFKYEMDRDLSEVFGIDFRKLHALEQAGALNLEEMPEAMWYSPEFNYVPQPEDDRKPKPLDETTMTPEERKIIAYLKGVRLEEGILAEM
jgi:hypothetical protein